MSNLDKNYILHLDLVKKVKNDKMEFSLSDNGTSVFYVDFTKNKQSLKLEDEQVILYIVKPNKEDSLSMKLVFDEDMKLFYCSLPNEFKDEEGEYIGQIVIINSSTEKIIVPNNIYYTVKSDILAEIGDIDLTLFS